MTDISLDVCICDQTCVWWSGIDCQCPHSPQHWLDSFTEVFGCKCVSVTLTDTHLNSLINSPNSILHILICFFVLMIIRWNHNSLSFILSFLPFSFFVFFLSFILSVVNWLRRLCPFLSPVVYPSPVLSSPLTSLPLLGITLDSTLSEH